MAEAPIVSADSGLPAATGDGPTDPGAAACVRRSVLTAVLLAALIVVIGAAPAPWFAILIAVLVVALALLFGVQLWRMKQCQLTPCNIFGVLGAGVGSGAAVLAIMLMIGFSAPRLFPTLGIVGTLFLILVLAAWMIGCASPSGPETADKGIAMAPGGPEKTDPYDRAVPAEVETWSVAKEGTTTLNYGEVHDMIHRDIAVGNDYRKERIKLLTTLATGVFALTVTFNKDLFCSTLTPTTQLLILAGWASLLVSLLAGIVHFRKWEDFYLEHRARGNALWRYRVNKGKGEEEKKARKDFHRSGAKIKMLQQSYKKWNFIQSGGLLVGLAFIAAYVAISGFTVSCEKPKGTTVSAVTGQTKGP